MFSRNLFYFFVFFLPLCPHCRTDSQPPFDNLDKSTSILSIESNYRQFIFLCFLWSYCLLFFLIKTFHSHLFQKGQKSEELDEKGVYLLLTLRRRKSLQQNIHSETLPLLDLSYYGLTERYLKQSCKWNFNTFSLDILTGGHSLSSLLLYFFKKYNFIDTFKLDLINVMRCFCK